VNGQLWHVVQCEECGAARPHRASTDRQGSTRRPIALDCQACGAVELVFVVKTMLATTDRIRRAAKDLTAAGWNDGSDCPQ